jgi:hypothetical protein
MTENEDRSNACCKDCKYVLIVKVRIKKHQDNRSATGVFGVYSLAGLMSQLKENSLSREKAYYRTHWFSFSPDGKQDRVVNDSNYTILAKVVRVCDLVGTKGLSWHEYQTPQALHEYVGSVKDRFLAGIRLIFAFHIA